MDFHYAYHSNIYYFTIKILVLCKFVSVGACFVWKNSVPCINSSVHNTRINTVNFINFQLRKGGIRSLPIFLNSKNQHLVACFPTVFTSMICVSFSDSQGQKKNVCWKLVLPLVSESSMKSQQKHYHGGSITNAEWFFWISWPP